MPCRCMKTCRRNRKLAIISITSIIRYVFILTMSVQAEKLFVGIPLIVVAFTGIARLELVG